MRYQRIRTHIHTHPYRHFLKLVYFDSKFAKQHSEHILSKTFFFTITKLPLRGNGNKKKKKSQIADTDLLYTERSPHRHIDRARSLHGFDINKRLFIYTGFMCTQEILP